MEIKQDNAPVTNLLMMLIFILSSISLYNERFFLKMILHPYSICKHKQYYRLLTSDLVHNDFMHLLLNETMLFFVCGNLEGELRGQSVYGSLQFLFIYLFSLFAGVLYTTIRRRNQFDFSSAGASGSILGCLMAFMILKPDKIAFYVPVFGGMKNMYVAFFYILILIWYQKRRDNEYIDQELHFFGALGGILATVLLFPDRI